MTKLEGTDRTKFAHSVGMGGTQLIAGNAAGKREGYATLDEAIADLQPQSTEESGHAASVVFQGDDGRYYARSITAKSGLEQNPYHRGDYLDDTDNVKIDEPFAAIVDGYTVTRSDAQVSGRLWMPPVQPVRDVDMPVHGFAANMRDSVYLTARSVLGDTSGYASKEDAVAAARQITSSGGARPDASAVVYHDGPRFYVRELMIDAGPPEHGSPTKYLKSFDTTPYGQRWVFDNPTVDAVVKGDTIANGWNK